MITNKYYELGRKELFKICRSITGQGVRKTLKIYKRYFPEIKIKKFLQALKFLIGQFHLNGTLKMHIFLIRIIKRSLTLKKIIFT